MKTYDFSATFGDFGSDGSSLKSYNEVGVLNTMYAFRDSVQRFTDISDMIHAIRQYMDNCWKGRALREFEYQFDSVFTQVRDMGDALGDIYDMLLDAQQAFYETDDKLGQQLSKAAENAGGGGSSAGKSGVEYTSELGDEYIPNLIPDPPPSKPVLVSTMGAAYKPDMSYQRMSPKPVLSSCMPSQLMVLLEYKSMALKPVLQSTIGAALDVVLTKSLLSPVEELVSTMGEQYIPFSDSVSPDRRDVRNNIITAEVLNIITDGMLDGDSRDEIIRRIGEAVIAHLDGDYPAHLRDEIASRLGQEIYNSLYGKDSTGEYGWTDNVDGFADDTLPKLISDAINTEIRNDWFIEIINILVKSGNNPLPPMIPTPTLVLSGSDFAVAPVNSISTFSGLSQLNPSQAAQVCGAMGQYNISVSIEQMVLGSVQNVRPLNLTQTFVLDSTNQSVLPGSLTIEFSAPQTHFCDSNTANFMLSATSPEPIQGAVMDIAKGWCAQSFAAPDLSGLQFPVVCAL